MHCSFFYFTPRTTPKIRHSATPLHMEQRYTTGDKIYFIEFSRRGAEHTERKDLSVPCVSARKLF